jgi:hypothetical protein
VFDFEDGRRAKFAYVDAPGDLRAALDSIDLARGGPVLVVVGGAGNMPDEVRVRARTVLGEAVIPACATAGAALIDGGTAAGVMQLVGETRAQHGAQFPLVGVAAVGTVHLPGPETTECDPGVELDANHSHFVLVPGDRWGDESRWILRVAAALAEPHGYVALVIGGGDVTAVDARNLRDAGATVLAVAGTGGVADDLAAAGSTAIDWQAAAALRAELIRSFASTV